MKLEILMMQGVDMFDEAVKGSALCGSLNEDIDDMIFDVSEYHVSER